MTVMPRTVGLAVVLGLLCISLVAAETTQLRLFHRLHHPGAAQAQFSERGTLLIADDHTVTFQLSSSFAKDLFSFSEALHTVKDKDLLLYQVALEREGDAGEAQWDISSVKACHLPKSTAEAIHLHTLDLDNPKPYAIDYFVSPVPHDGACQKSSPKRSTAKSVPLQTFESFANVNSTVVLKSPRFPPLPQLTTPPVLSPEGEPVVPVPEKTFLQKYWMYIVGFLLITLLTGGGEEERPRNAK
ncbi:hypothetical protein LshimejAT787_0108240 [Lyophyllum shimeji]|uniref:ER membrane protein complex subunit 10 n=1 Tax=Lyophyllum shimeji TaxID=47721 RepID=A0A9P3UJZ9_LYOSH|nr:hypothetical protein LshimejAT787_0108240 [Lyophyllum shimeji]